MITLEQYTELYQNLKHNKGNINDIILREAYLINEGAKDLPSIINHVTTLFTSKHLIHLLKGEKVDEIIVTEIFTKLDKYPKNGSLRISYRDNVSWVYYISLINPRLWEFESDRICETLVKLAEFVRQGKITKPKAVLYKDKKFIYDDIDKLSDFIDSFEVIDTTESILINDRTYINNGAEIELENSNFLIVSIKTQEASDFYGQFSKWCTVTKNSDMSMLEVYNRKGKLFVIIDKKLIHTKNDLRCIAIQVESSQCVDVSDKISWFIFDGSYPKYTDLNRIFNFTRVLKDKIICDFSNVNDSKNNRPRFIRNMKTLNFYQNLKRLDLSDNNIDDNILYKDILPYIHENCADKIIINLQDNPLIKNSVLDLNKIKFKDLNATIKILGRSIGGIIVTIKNAGDSTNAVKVTDRNMLANLLFTFRGDLSIFDVSAVSDMKRLFYNTFYSKDIKDLDISKWDVSGVTNMSQMFMCSKFNINISDWKVSNVNNMRQMFYESEFNGDISGWDVSKVTDMWQMFADSKFNKDISKWNVGDKDKVNTESIFNGCSLDPLPKWYTNRTTE